MMARVASRKAAGNLSAKLLAGVSFDKSAVPELNKFSVAEFSIFTCRNRMFPRGLAMKRPPEGGPDKNNTG
ncbi:hypothetical protein D3C80_1554570 [compost metagenome]